MNGLKTNTLLAALLTLMAGSVHRLRRPCAISASHNASSLLALAFLGFFLLSGQAHALLINGDFETGNLNGWTTFITNSGSIGENLTPILPDVSVFDTVNGVPSNAARFQVGSGGQGAGGGGISQNVNTAAGMLTATADIAVSRTQTGTNNAGGLFELLINDVVVDNFDFMSVTGGVDEHASLSGIDTVAAGMQTIAIRMTRPFSNGGTFGTAVFQHVDNVASIFVPEPTTWVLLLIGAMLAPLVGRRAAMS